MKIILFTLVFVKIAAAQSFNIQVGYTGFNLSDQKKQFEQIVQFFNEFADGDFVVPIQENLPSNYIVSGAAIYPINEKIDLGVMVSLTKTNSYALYGDVLGNIDFKSDFNMFLVGGLFQNNFSTSEDYKLGLGAILSVGSYSYKVELKVEYPQLPEYNSSSSDSYSGTLFAGEPYLYFTYNILKEVALICHIGYRIGTSIKPDNEQVYPIQFNSDNEQKANTSGYVLAIGIQYSL